MAEGKDALEVIQNELGELILHVEVARRRDSRLGILDRSAFRLMGELIQNGPIGVTALADVFQLDLSTVSRQITALVAKGLVRRVSNQRDGRASLLEVTEAGRAQFLELLHARKQLFSELLDGWTDIERERLAEYLTRINDAIIRRVRSRENP